MRFKKFAFSFLTVLLIFLFCSCADAAKSSSPRLDKIMDGIKWNCSLPDKVIEIKSAESFAKTFGISKDDIKQFIAYVPENDMVQDYIVMVQVKKSAQRENAVNKITELYNERLENARQYLPDEYEMIKNCKVGQKGNYIYLFISADAQKMTDTFNSYFEN